MQKVLRINITSRNAALKAARQQNLRETKSAWREHDNANVVIARKRRENVKAERKNRREDWMAGPLAPDRNTGNKKGRYGTVDVSTIRGPELPEVARRGPKGNGWDAFGSEGEPGQNLEWEGEGSEGNIVVGDRVCVVAGRQGVIGRIGEVKEVHPARGECVVDGVNMADITIPETYLAAQAKSNANAPRHQSVELPLKLSDVRLVMRVVDTESNLINRDVIVRHVRGGAPYFQREYGFNIPRHTRYVMGEDIEIPWPPPEIPELSRQEGDTTRVDVEAVTYWPKVLEDDGLTADVVDELRPKFSRARPWHDGEYLKMKVVEDMRSRWWEGRRLVGPKQEAHERRLRLKQLQQLQQQGGAGGGLDPETERIIEETRKVNLGI